MGLTDIKAFKKIPETEDLLDCAGRAELAANEFRITQTEQKLKRDGIQGEERAFRTHEIVGREVRSAIKRVGGTMPEHLPPEAPIKKLIAEQKQARKMRLKAASNNPE